MIDFIKKIRPQWSLLLLGVFFFFLPPLDVIVYSSILLGSILFHEFGHYIVARKRGIDTDVIYLDILGARISIDNTGTWKDNFLITISGVLFNLILFLIFYLLPQTKFIEFAATLNLILAIFNMIPIGGLDGNRALRFALAGVLPHVHSSILDLYCSVIGVILGLIIVVGFIALAMYIVAIYFAICLISDIINLFSHEREFRRSYR